MGVFNIGYHHFGGTWGNGDIPLRMVIVLGIEGRVSAKSGSSRAPLNFLVSSHRMNIAPLN